MDDEIPIIKEANSRSKKDSFSTTLTNALADIPTSVADRMHNVKNPFGRMSLTATPNQSRKNSLSTAPSPHDTPNSPGRPFIRRSMTSSALADLAEESQEQSAFKNKRAGLPDITFTNPFQPTHKLNLDRPSRPTPKHRPSRMRNFILGEKDLEMVNEKLSTKRVNFIHKAADLDTDDERLFAHHEVHHEK
ncbi:hypothetical protein FIBSPDRAFT_858524 [Athelia psychrophila]|uniref:Uncharacterized protein n=1 Tax=Athelia psychrophila TaxID=1759441 RepID=A0A166LSG2_9AGAM|nr:hypothetical protein FIBSPDRAFT_858524 [Fibularhizoctonia sp. CBS 109695]